MNQFVSKDFPGALTRQGKPMSVYRLKAGKARLIKDSTSLCVCVFFFKPYILFPSLLSKAFVLNTFM